MYPEIKNPYYHNLSFKEIDKIKEDLLAGKLKLYINTAQLYLYLNQINKKYSLILRWVQNLKIISIIGAIIFLFFDWRISIVLGVLFLLTGLSTGKLAMKFIRKHCLEDRVFLKFALACELVKVSDKGLPLTDAIYKQSG